jgi:hypothetical protein
MDIPTPIAIALNIIANLVVLDIAILTILSFSHIQDNRSLPSKWKPLLQQ